MVEIQVRTNPFPGLRPFRASETHLFFGREGQTDELLRRLRSHRFLSVVGVSGSGKSSLVRAGLLPALYSGFMTQAGSSWQMAVLRPGGAPIANLAQALNAPSVIGSTGENARLQTILTDGVLRRGALGLVEVVQQSKLPQGENLLVVVDQFEELFRFKKKAGAGDEAAAFVKLLLEANQQTELPIYIILTMRSDFLGDCAQFQDLPETMNDSQYLIPRMTRDQQRLAITGPVAVGGGEITPGLVNRLLNDMGDSPDQLPILQHALMRTWDDWENQGRNGPIDIQHYKKIGTLAEALSQHADEIYQALDTRERQLTEQLFKCLTERGSDNRGIRRPIQLQQFCNIANANLEEVRRIIDQFRAPDRSFLMTPAKEQLDESDMVDISHESLIRVWRRLKGWIDEEWESARIYRRLAEDASRYAQDKASLWRNPELAEALNWQRQNQPNEAWARLYGNSFERAMEFLNKSRDESYAEEERRREEKVTRRLSPVGIGEDSKISQSFGGGGTEAYLSYSRRDKEVAQRIYAAFMQSNRDIWVDWEDIPPSANWWAEIQAGIEGSQNLIFLLSPDSLQSKFCLKEVEYATELNKRILPVVVREGFDIQQVYPALAKMNWIFCRKSDDFGRVFHAIIQALDTDLDYVRAHTWLLVKAIEWERQNRDGSFLLQGVDLEAAEQLVAQSMHKEPRLTNLQSAYVTNSRMRQTEMMRAAMRQRRRTSIALSISLLLLFVLGLFGFHQYRLAQHYRTELENLRQSPPPSPLPEP